jgi:hypothetical protein
MSDVQADPTLAYLRRIDARLDRLDARIEALALTDRPARRDSLDRLFGTIRTLLIVLTVVVIGLVVLRLAAVATVLGWLLPSLSHLPR